MSQWQTHEVENQAPLLENYNLFESDLALKEAVNRESGTRNFNHLSQFGQWLGRSETIHLGTLANQNPPIFHSHDRHGRRLDTVEFHPAYHEIFKATIAAGAHCLPWDGSVTGGHVAHAALCFMAYQIESGHTCPTTMTYGCVPSLKKEPAIWKKWQSYILSREYDSSFQPIEKKKGALIGMAMTEKQGGSDIRANSTKAEPISTRGPGKEYRLTGHKWFCSHPTSDAFLVTAKTEQGISCFFVPRWLPDGSKNNIFIQRLKDKMGDRSNASSEIELINTWGLLIGEEGRGVPNIIEMANHTRLDCAVGSAGLMRQALAQALNHACHRKAFGQPLSHHAMMERLLGDLIIESEAATSLSLRLAGSYDHQDDQDFEGPFRRIATAISKYWITKRSVSFANECMEIHGGTGYVEESLLPRLFRQSPLNSIWEGSGNIMCLDVLRSLQKKPGSLEALRAEMAKAHGLHPSYDNHLKRIEEALKAPETLLSNARHLVEQIALALQASLMLRFSDPGMAEAFCQSRLPHGPNTYGTLSGNFDFQKWIERSAPN